LLIARTSLGEQLARLQKRLVSLARDDQRARLLTSTPGVGVLAIEEEVDLVVGGLTRRVIIEKITKAA
jgi:hypothetical protein